MCLTFTINGKRWRFKREYLPNFYVNGEEHERRGDCDPPDTPNKTIRVNKKLKGKEELEVTLHEFRHAENWHYDEDYVKERSSELANILWRLGYRKQPSAGS